MVPDSGGVPEKGVCALLCVRTWVKGGWTRPAQRTSARLSNEGITFSGFPPVFTGLWESLLHNHHPRLITHQLRSRRRLETAAVSNCSNNVPKGESGDVAIFTVPVTSLAGIHLSIFSRWSRCGQTASAEQAWTKSSGLAGYGILELVSYVGDPRRQKPRKKREPMEGTIARKCGLSDIQMRCDVMCLCKPRIYQMCWSVWYRLDLIDFNKHRHCFGRRLRRPVKAFGIYYGGTSLVSRKPASRLLL